MTIKELKEKISEFEKALIANESAERVNPILKEVLQDSLIDLQAQLIMQLDELIEFQMNQLEELLESVADTF
jgi:hypothetical protein